MALSALELGSKWNLEAERGIQCLRTFDQKLFIGHKDAEASISLINLVTMDEPTELIASATNPPNNWISDLAISRDGTQVLAVCRDRRVRVFDLQAKAFLGFLEDHQILTWAVDTSPTADLAVTGGNDRRLIFWRLAKDIRLPTQIAEYRFEEWIRYHLFLSIS